MEKRKLLGEEVLSEKVVLKRFESEQFKGDRILGVEKEIILPTMSDAELWAIYQQIKPMFNKSDYKSKQYANGDISITEIPNDNWYWLKKLTPEQLRNIAFLWDAKKDKRRLVDNSKIETIDEFQCFHTYGYHGLFKPSVAEVLQQMPDKLKKHANGFRITKSPNVAADLWGADADITNAGCHRSTVQALIVEK